MTSIITLPRKQERWRCKVARFPSSQSVITKTPKKNTKNLFGIYGSCKITYAPSFLPRHHHHLIKGPHQLFGRRASIRNLAHCPAYNGDLRLPDPALLVGYLPAVADGFDYVAHEAAWASFFDGLTRCSARTPLWGFFEVPLRLARTSPLHWILRRMSFDANVSLREGVDGRHCRTRRCVLFEHRVRGRVLSILLCRD